jgi:hypothetical protein
MALEKAWPPTYGDATEILIIGSGTLITFFTVHDDANFIANKVLSAPPKLHSAAVVQGGEKMARREQKAKRTSNRQAIATR